MQLQSVASLVAVDGALSVSASSAGSIASSGTELEFDFELVVLLVDVRFRGVLPINGAVKGGLTREGDASDTDLRKSMYAMGGVMGVFSSCLITAAPLVVMGKFLKSAPGRVAEGRPADGIGPFLEAERGVRTDVAERIASAGKLAETGVVSCASFGLLVAILTC